MVILKFPKTLLVKINIINTWQSFEDYLKKTSFENIDLPTRYGGTGLLGRTAQRTNKTRKTIITPRK